MAGSTLKGEPVPCQGGGGTQFPREGVRVRLNMGEGGVEGGRLVLIESGSQTPPPLLAGMHTVPVGGETEKKGGGGNKQT